MGQSLFSQVMPKLAEELSHYIVPIFSRQGDTGIHVGTSFLVDHEHEPFLVTAAHVLDELGTLGRNLSIYRDPHTFVDLDGTAFKTRISDTTNLDLDVGIIHLRGACRPPFEAVSKKALPSHVLSPASQSFSGPYLVAGFPASKSKPDFSSPVHRSGYWPVVIASEAHPNAYSGKGLSRDTHIIMPWQKRRVTDLEGKIINPNSFKGMSGCPVFALHWNVEKQSLQGVEVIGVFIEHRKSPNVLVATKCFVVRDGIKILLSKRSER